MKQLATRAARWLSPALGLAALAGLGSAIAAQDIGYVGPSLAGSGPTTGNPTVTESKPENKVWNHDGKWWSSMWSSSALEFRIHRLDPVTHAWIDTGVAVEARRDSHSDALFDGTNLYILSHEFASGSKLGRPIILQRYSYSAGAFVQDAGFPVTIGNYSTETATIEKDSTGKLWAVWKQGLRVYYTYSIGSDTLWSEPAVLPGCVSDFDQDDICAIQRFGGNKIGVMWNDNVQADYLFTVHVDGQDPATWSPVEVAWDGQSDDHINLSADSAGRVFAAVKNDNEEMMLLVRTSGVWSQHLISDESPEHRLSRPIVLLNEQDRTIHVYASFNGAIYKKTSSMDTISFEVGLGTMVMRDVDGVINNPTSTRQNFTASTGLVVLAANMSQTGTYWHYEIPPVIAGLTMNQPLPGVAGVQNVFVAKGATPNAVVTFVTSPTTGNTLISRPNCPLGLQTTLGSPILMIGTAKANATGLAALSMIVPAGVAGKTYHFQVLEIGKCKVSNMVTEVF